MKSLLQKLRDPSFIERLSHKRRRELRIAMEVLSEHELDLFSSIPVAYAHARERIIEDYISKVEPELYILLRENPSRPIFSWSDILREWKEFKGDNPPPV